MTYIDQIEIDRDFEAEIVSDYEKIKNILTENEHECIEEIIRVLIQKDFTVQYLGCDIYCIGNKKISVLMADKKLQPLIELYREGGEKIGRVTIIDDEEK
nr:MAG TPA: hypothetical protein [Caudoviricetes sp.]